MKPAEKINPEKITKPFQLLAVWLLGLIILVSLLLTAANTIVNPYWLPPFFSISAVVLIIVVLTFVFLLQTKYRPQMLEDKHFVAYLDTNKPEKSLREKMQKSKKNLPETEKIKKAKSKPLTPEMEKTKKAKSKLVSNQ